MNVAELVGQLWTFRLQMKTFHYQTPTFAHHKLMDELVDVVDRVGDALIEAIQGARGKRLRLGKRFALTLHDMSLSDVLTAIRDIRHWLLETFALQPVEAPLLTLRDELIVQLDKTAYLLSFS